MCAYSPITVPRSAKYGNNYWNTNGPKVGMREVTLYSDLEFDHWVHIETDPDVITYCEQPAEIQFVTEDEILHTSILDMWIQYKSGRQVFREVKYSKELNTKDPRNARTHRQIEAQKKWCQQNGFHHEVVTEIDLRANRLELENRVTIVTFIRNFKNFQPEYNLESLLCCSPKSLLSLSQQLNASFREIRNECIWLLYHGKIRANLEKRLLGTETEIWLT